jgi:hypothetical protein
VQRRQVVLDCAARAAVAEREAAARRSAERERIGRDEHRLQPFFADPGLREHRAVFLTDAALLLSHELACQRALRVALGARDTAGRHQQSVAQVFVDAGELGAIGVDRLEGTQAMFDGLGSQSHGIAGARDRSARRLA